MSEADDHAVSQPQMGRRWFVVFLVAAMGVIGLGVWEILEGRTGTGIGYIAVAASVTLLVVILRAYGRRRL